MEMQSNRRQQGISDLGITDKREIVQINHAISKEIRRQTKKERRRKEIEESFSYQHIKWIKTLMDEYFLDPILGLIPGIGDAITSFVALPFIYVSLFKVRSIPLTLSVIFNFLSDALLGMLPLWIGNICDFFYRASRKSLREIVGFVEDDRNVISAVNKKAAWMAVLIVIFCYLIYLAILLLQKMWEWTWGILDWSYTSLVGLFT